MLLQCLKMFVNYRIVLVFVFVPVIGLANGGRHICDVCSCVPSKEKPSSIACNCEKSTSKLLLFKEDDDEFMAITSELILSKCNFLSLPTNGFSKARNLRHVTFEDLNYLHLIKGVFPFLQTLTINRVKQLIFAEQVFSSKKNLKSVTVTNSNLTTLPNLALFDARLLSTFQLSDVYIKEIVSGSLFNANNSDSDLSLRLTDCQVGKIQSDGIDIAGSELIITNSTFGDLQPKAITAVIRHQVQIIQNSFKNQKVSSETLYIKAPVMNISSNEFANLPSIFLNELHLTSTDPEPRANDDEMIIDVEPKEEDSNRIVFMNNVILDIDLSAFFLKLRYKEVNFQSNLILCDCSPEKTSVFKLSDFFGLAPMANMTVYHTILDNNYCQSYRRISLREFKNQYFGGLICKETVLPTLNDAQADPVNSTQFSTPMSPQEKSFRLEKPQSSNSELIQINLGLSALSFYVAFRFGK